MTMAETDRHVSVSGPFSSGDIVEWLKCFEICSKVNKWIAKTQALKFPTACGRSTSGVCLREKH